MIHQLELDVNTVCINAYIKEDICMSPPPGIVSIIVEEMTSASATPL